MVEHPIPTQCHLVQGRCWGAEVTGVEHEAISAVGDSARAGKLGLSGNSHRCRIRPLSPRLVGK